MISTRSLRTGLSLLPFLVLVIGSLSVDARLRATSAEHDLEALLNARLDDPCYRHRLSRNLPSDSAAEERPRHAAYSGVLTHHYEELSLRPCGGSETWWLEIDPCTKDQDRLARLTHGRIPPEAPARHVFVTLQGVLSPVGHWGHVGQYKRSLWVSAVLEARLPSRHDCR